MTMNLNENDCREPQDEPGSIGRAALRFLDPWGDNPLLPVILGKRLDIPGRDMRVVHRGELAPDMSNAIGIVETVRTGPGTPFAAIGAIADSMAFKHLTDQHAEAMDETAEWAQPRYTREQLVQITRDIEKNQRMRDQLEAMATVTSPRGSMGEDAYGTDLMHTWQHDETGRTTQAATSPGPRWAMVATPPKDPHCAMTPQCPGALGKGCYLCEPVPFDGTGTTMTRTTLSEPYVDAATGYLAQDLRVEVVPESEWREPIPGREWSGIPGDPFIHLERTRRTPLGAEPWDHGAGEAS